MDSRKATVSAPEGVAEVDGYVANVPFEPSYRPEQSPPLLRLLTASRAIRPVGRPFRYLDLGFGMGTTLNIHAAACPGEYWGCDINPRHVAAASELARRAGTDVRTLQVSFAQLLERSDLPSFDIVVAHGVWSWVSESNRAVILQILRRQLAPGGLFCLNSLALPGAAHGLPLQRLMRLHKRLDSGRLDSGRLDSGQLDSGQLDRGTAAANDRSASGLAFAKRLREAGAPYFAPGSASGQMLERIERSDPNYLAHEYLNDNWHPALFADTAAALASAGLHFVASGDPIGNCEELRFTPAQRAVLDPIEQPALRESAKDFLRPKWQRTDIFLKSDQKVSPRRPRIGRDDRFVLGLPPAAVLVGEHPAIDGSLKFDGPPFREIVVALASAGHRPKSFGELIEASAATEGEVTRALLVLIAHDAVHPVHDPAPAPATIAACDRLNGELLKRARAGDEFPVLASPVAGHGVSVPRFQRLCLLAMREGARSVERWATFAQDVLKRDGVALAAPEVLKQALLFEASLPSLAALGLIDPKASATG